MWLPLTRLPSWIYKHQTAFIMTSLTQIECLVIRASSISLKKIKRSIYQFCDHAFTKLNGKGITCAIHPNKKEGWLMQIFICLTSHWWLKFLLSSICICQLVVLKTWGCSLNVYSLWRNWLCVFLILFNYIHRMRGKRSVSNCQMCGSFIYWYCYLCR